MACVVQLFTRAPAYLPEPLTSFAIVGIVVLMSMLQVGRLREVDFLRNLGVTWSAQALLALTAAGSLELAARAVAVLLQSQAGAG